MRRNPLDGFIVFILKKSKRIIYFLKVVRVGSDIYLLHIFFSARYVREEK